MAQTRFTPKYTFSGILTILWLYQLLSKNCWNYLAWHQMSMDPSQAWLIALTGQTFNASVASPLANSKPSSTTLVETAW